RAGSTPSPSSTRNGGRRKTLHESVKKTQKRYRTAGPVPYDVAMDQTRQSLLLRAQTGEEDAWKDLTDLYRPLILAWLNRQGVPAGDLEDLSQDILLRVVKHLPGFQHSGHRGAFRSWLRTIVCSRTADYCRALDAVTQAGGGSGATAALQQLADPDSDLNRQWDEEHDRYVLSC